MLREPLNTQAEATGRTTLAWAGVRELSPGWVGVAREPSGYPQRVLDRAQVKALPLAGPGGGLRPSDAGVLRGLPNVCDHERARVGGGRLPRRSLAPSSLHPPPVMLGARLASAGE